MCLEGGGCGVPAIFLDLRPEIHVRYAAERCRSCRRIRDAAIEARRCEVFNKYSQMKVLMKREALGKLNRNANESGKGSDTVEAGNGCGRLQGSDQAF